MGKNMETITINLNKVWGELSFMNLLKTELQLSAYCGNNWDALDECMCDLSRLHGDTKIVFINAEKLRKKAPQLFERIDDSVRYWQSYWQQAGLDRIRIEFEIK